MCRTMSLTNKIWQYKIEFTERDIAEYLLFKFKQWNECIISFKLFSKALEYCNKLNFGHTYKDIAYTK